MRASLQLVGMAAAREWLRTPGATDESRRVVDDLLRLTLLDLIDRAVRTVGSLPLRLVARRHEEPILGVWQQGPTGETHLTLHQLP